MCHYFYVLLRFITFYYVCFKVQKTFYVFLLSCIRFLDQWVLLYIVLFIKLPWNLGYRSLKVIQTGTIIGHWRSFRLVPFQSVTSHRPSEIVLSFVCSGTVQVWWMINAKSVEDHSRHVVRRLQSSVIHMKTHYSAPAGSSKLSMLHFGEG